MKKNVDEACVTLEAATTNLENVTLVAAMESKVDMAGTKIWRKNDIAKCELEMNEPLYPSRDGDPDPHNELDLLGLKHVANNDGYRSPCKNQFQYVHC